MNRAPVISVAVGFAILAAIFFAVVFYTAVLHGAAGEVRRNVAITTQLIGLLSTVQDAESGERGFLLTGDEIYLEPYRSARAGAREQLATLVEETASDPFLSAKAELLSDAVLARLQALDDTIQIYTEQSLAAAVEVLQAARGLQQMTGIRALLEEMNVYQQDMLAAAFAERDAVALRLQLAVGIGVLAVVVVGAFAVWSARRNVLRLADQTRLAEERAVALEAGNNQLRVEMENRRVAESQLQQIQKMEAIGQLTGGIAHDFNNMLAVVMSAIGLIRRKLERGETDIEKFLDGAADAAERSATLTHRLLAFSRQQTLEPQPIDANKFVAGMSELLRRTLGESIQLETVLAGGLWKVSVDASQLESAIINLAANARDAMEEGGGRITIETANCHLDDAYARENPGAVAGQFVLVAVTDTGSGMAPDVLNRAFDPFFTTKPVGRGTGLGLSQVYGFAKQSSGHIKIYSELGTGTTVKMYLPRYLGSDEAKVRRSVSTTLETGQSSEVVLVVEDDDRVRLLAVESLNELGYTVIDARDGEEALEILRSRTDIRLLFTDVIMPRMSGRQLAEAAQQVCPDLKVLYTTGFTRNAVVHNGVLDPGVLFLAKPFTIGQLAAKVREAFDG